MGFSSLALGAMVPSPLALPLSLPLPVVRKGCLLNLITRRHVVRVAEKDSQVLISPIQHSRHSSLQVQVISRNRKALSGDLSRREAMSFLFAASLLTFIPVEPVEARSTKQENKRKVREKLEKLREKVGIPKEKTESSSGSNENPPPNPLSRLTTPLVEATL